MAKHALMKRGSETMNVPSDKVKEYLEAGWTIVEQAAEAPVEAVKAEQPEAETPGTVEDVSLDEAVNTVRKKRKG